MSRFTSTQFEFFNHIATRREELDENTVILDRGTLHMTITKRDDGKYDIFCSDDEYTVFLRVADLDLETAVKKAFQGYMEKSAAVRQTRQFILNAEEEIKEFHKKTGKEAI